MTSLRLDGDFEQSLKTFQLEIISLLVNFASTLEQMTR